jgi:hypothetical protein
VLSSKTSRQVSSGQNALNMAFSIDRSAHIIGRKTCHAQNQIEPALKSSQCPSIIFMREIRIDRYYSNYHRTHPFRSSSMDLITKDGVHFLQKPPHENVLLRLVSKLCSICNIFDGWCSPEKLYKDLYVGFLQRQNGQPRRISSSPRSLISGNTENVTHGIYRHPIFTSRSSLIRTTFHGGSFASMWHCHDLKVLKMLQILK